MVKELITPELAKTYLSSNVGNRSLSRPWYLHLASQMKEGRWKYNGECIKFSSDGRLLDGQHRLAAIVASGVPCDMGVIRDLPNDVFYTLDTGKMRTGRDTLSVLEIKSTSEVVSALRGVHIYRLGEKTGLFSRLTKVTNERYLNLLESCRGIQDSVSCYVSLKKKYNLSNACLPALHYLCGLVSTLDRDEFFNQLFTGVVSEERSPILYFRDALISNRGRFGKKRRPNEMLRLGIYCWNKWRSGEVMRKYHNTNTFIKIS